MIKMVTKQNIIHWHMSGMSQRSIARQAKVSRRTVQKILHEYEQVRQTGNEEALEDLLTPPPRYDSSSRTPRVLTPAVKSIIQTCLQENRKKTTWGKRKQRMLKRDIIFEVLRCKGTTFFSFLQDVAQKKRHLCSTET